MGRKGRDDGCAFMPRTLSYDHFAVMSSSKRDQVLSRLEKEDLTVGVWPSPKMSKPHTWVTTRHSLREQNGLFLIKAVFLT